MTITRTINSTTVHARVFNISAGEMGEKYFPVSGKHDFRDKEVEKAFKAFEKENPDFRVLDIIDYKVESGLYAMPEEVFLMYAERIGDGR